MKALSHMRRKERNVNKTSVKEELHAYITSLCDSDDFALHLNGTLFFYL